MPLVGVIIGGLLVPAATLGLMAATEEATKGRFPMPSVLISAFRAGRQRARAMLLLGVDLHRRLADRDPARLLVTGDQPPAEGERRISPGCWRWCCTRRCS